MSRTTLYWFLTCQNLEKTNEPIPRKRSDRRKGRQKDGRTDSISILKYPSGYRGRSNKILILR